MSESHSHKKAAHEFQDGVHKLGEDVTELKDNLSGLAHDATSTAVAGATEIKRTLKRTIDSGRKSAAHAVESVSESISERPFTSVAIAAGVGFLLGALLVRSRK